MYIISLIFFLQIKLLPYVSSSFAINIAKRVGLPDKVIDRASELLRIFKDNEDTDEEVLNGRKEPDSKFNLLRTDASNAKFNE